MRSLRRPERRSDRICEVPLLLFLAAGLLALFAPNAARAQSIIVDMHLLLAVDVSGSIDYKEAKLQRDGYVAAIKDEEIISTMLSGPTRRIALGYVEWAADDHQRVAVDWTLIDSREAAHAFADTLDQRPFVGGRRTSISKVLEFSVDMFRRSPFLSERRVIDISGDGPNNAGARVDKARDKAVAQGITINALPILNDRASPYGFPQLDDLDVYFEECVIGGEGAFVIAAKDFRSFGAAVRRKLILEVAGLMPERRPRIHLAESGMGPGGYDCMIGEKQLDRFLNRGGG